MDVISNLPDMFMQQLESPTSIAVMTVTTLIVCLISVYLFYRYKYTYWTRQNINGPKPRLFFGNAVEMVQENFMTVQKRWLKEYGKCYGFYRGTRPILAIADPEISRLVCIQDFKCFTDHETDRPMEYHEKGFLFFSTGERWRRVRTLTTPTFTSGKIKRMYKLLDLCVEDLLQLIEKLRQKDSGLINMKAAYNYFTLDGITACCYGLRLEREDTEKYSKAAPSRDYFLTSTNRLATTRNFRLLITVALPLKLSRFLGFYERNVSDLTPYAKIVRKIVEGRNLSSNKNIASSVGHGGRKFDDYLQTLLDYQPDDGSDEVAKNQNAHSKLNEPNNMTSTNSEHQDTESDLKLTDMEMIGNAMFMLSTGLETVGTLLTNVTYALAHNQHIQEILYGEIVKLKDETGKFSYDDINSSLYLDAVVSETLRMLTILLRMDRKANCDYEIKKYNVKIRKGDEVNIFFYSIMNDPDYWEQPEIFNPDRFMPGQKEKIVSGAYCPFGIGPRHCLGMRFSLAEAKLALVHMMMKYRFEPAPGTSFPPELRPGTGTTGIVDPHVRVLIRS